MTQTWNRRFARGLAVAGFGLLGFFGSAGLSSLYNPDPAVHDEFSYLLAADTFAHGRLTNPSHPMWQHFETFHVVWQPTYASKYPPAQGLLLALGQIALGRPQAGVWMGMGMALAAVCWMLLAWMPLRWAALGTSLAAMQWLLLNDCSGRGYWAHGYWGGGVAAIGGALLFGAARRLVRRPGAGPAVALGLGLAVLANSRPFEGLVVSLPVLLFLFVWAWPRRSRLFFRRVVVPLLFVLVPVGLWMLYYNVRVTGHALQMPYMLHEALYGATPFFLWQTPPPEPVYRNEMMHKFHMDWELPYFALEHTLSGFWVSTLSKAECFYRFYLRPVLWIGLLPLLLGRRRPWDRLLLWSCGLLALAFLQETWVQPHYAAPLAAAVVALVTGGIRRLHAWQGRARWAARLLAWSIPIGAVALSLNVVKTLTTFPPARAVTWTQQRSAIARQLEEAGGRHLVLVRYAEAHDVLHEWVYNGADIDGAAVVWARELEPAANQRLLQYFADRRIWRAFPDGSPPRIEEIRPALR